MYTIYPNASIIPLLRLMLVHMWYEESTPRDHSANDLESNDQCGNHSSSCSIGLANNNNNNNKALMVQVWI